MIFFLTAEVSQCCVDLASPCELFICGQLNWVRAETTARLGVSRTVTMKWVRQMVFFFSSSLFFYFFIFSSWKTLSKARLPWILQFLIQVHVFLVNFHLCLCDCVKYKWYNSCSKPGNQFFYSNQHIDWSNDKNASDVSYHVQFLCASVGVFCYFFLTCGPYTLRVHDPGHHHCQLRGLGPGAAPSWGGQDPHGQETGEDKTLRCKICVRSERLC